MRQDGRVNFVDLSSHVTFYESCYCKYAKANVDLILINPCATAKSKSQNVITSHSGIANSKHKIWCLYCWLVLPLVYDDWSSSSWTWIPKITDPHGMGGGGVLIMK